MKTILATIATLVALTSVASAQDRTREHRIWAADQMINRLTGKIARVRNVCDRSDWKVLMPRLSDECKATVARAYPILTTIREVATSGDAVQWTALIDVAHTMEAAIDASMVDLERK